jgi:FMN phosphatase YigB (HAD superfamily)
MIKAIIFDLDNCLAAANEVGEHLFEPAFEAIRNANSGTLTAEELAEAFKECWRDPLDFVAEKFGFSQEMLIAGWKVFSQTVVETPMIGYGDLAILRELPFDLYLVTSGFRRLQESKVKALEIRPLFRGIEIDALDEAERKGKQGIFEAILEERKLKPKEVVIAGDNPDSEIEAGNRLGMKTVQILRPASSRRSVVRSPRSPVSSLSVASSLPTTPVRTTKPAIRLPANTKSSSAPHRRR